MKPKVVSWAQNGEDVVLARALDDIDAGFYVDVGAADPDGDSVTKMFYDRGWQGINIEPNVDFLTRLVAQRPRDINLGCAVASVDTTRILSVVPGTGLSTLSEEYAERHRSNGYTIRQDAIVTRSLNSILEEHCTGDIHFLKIDVEGFEDDVLASIDLSRYRPWIILYEATEPNTNTPVVNGIQARLEDNGYQFVLFDGLNKYFVANEQSARAAHVFPANIVDNFIRFTEIEREAARDSAVTYAEDLLRTLQLKDELLAVRDTSLSEKERALAEKGETLGKRDQELADKDKILSARNKELKALKSSFFGIAHQKTQFLRKKLTQAKTATPAAVPARVAAVAQERNKGTSPRAAFTICSWNYMGYAITLRQSLAATHPDLPFYIFVADRPRTEIARALQEDRVIVVDESIAPDFERMALRYSIMEYNTSIKPHCFDYLFDTLGHQSVIYLDPDILVLGPLDEIYANLAAEADCVLTPHITAPLDDGKMPDDLSIARAGIYNLGFAGLANRPEARRFVTWWRRWLDTDCVVDFPRGIFVDQRFCDFAPSFIRKTKILHDPGYNLAYWNLLHRPVEWRNGALYAGDSPVKFVHFSGFNKNKPQQFSKHQNRFTRATIGELGPVFDDYIKSINANDRYQGGAFSKIPYGLSGVIDGVPMNNVMRACLRRYEHEIPAGTTVFDLTGAFFAAPIKPPRDGEQPISRLLGEIHRARPDLQSAFNLGTRAGRNGLVQWATMNAHSELSVPVDWVVPRQGQSFPSAPTRSYKNMKGRIKRETKRIKRQFVSLFSGSQNRTPWPIHNSFAPLPQRPQPTTSTRHGLAVYGFLHTETGIGQAGRALSAAFATTGGLLSNHALTPPGFDNNVDFPVASSLANNVDHALLAINADNIRHLASYMDPAHVATNRRLGLFFWELPVFPGVWSSATDMLDEVWVATSFVRDSLASATTKPVHIVPLPVPLNDLDQAESRSELGLPADRPIYLVTFDFNSYPQRKNPIAAVRAFIDAFPKASTSAPLLVVKCHGAHNRSGHEAALHAAVDGHNHIMLIDRVMSKPEMLQLQAACDVHVSLHRSEGFGLNLAEAMAAGKLAVGTNFSGNVDFMTPANSLLIDYKMQRLEKDDYVFWHGQWWADPDHDHAVAALRQAESTTLREQLGARARSDVANTLSLDRVGSIMSRLIDGAT